MGPLRLGAFGYFGLESADDVSSEIRAFGPDLTLTVGPELELNAQYLRRTDERPFLSSDAEPDSEIDMGFAELVWSPGSCRRSERRLAGSARGDRSTPRRVPQNRSPRASRRWLPTGRIRVHIVQK